MDTPSPSVDVSPGDAFDILRLEPRFDLDERLLAERHRTLSLALHPDRFAGRPSVERRLSLQQAMLVNSAYRTLRDPIARAELLAERRGLTIPVDLAMSPELLERTMERREALSEAVLAGDQTRILELAQQGRREQEELHRRVAESFDGSVESGTGPTLGEAISALRFLRRFIESAEAELDAHHA